jgi:hypothetical protein
MPFYVVNNVLTVSGPVEEVVIVIPFRTAIRLLNGEMNPRLFFAVEKVTKVL